jgi:hypothetical protein
LPHESIKDQSLKKREEISKFISLDFLYDDPENLPVRVLTGKKPVRVTEEEKVEEKVEYVPKVY